MALRNLTEGDCGQVNPLVQLASHALQDRALRDDVGLPSTSGQWTQQYMVDNMMAPQTFRMDHLMREMQEIESQRALVPPVPASAVKDHLWAGEYHNEVVQKNIQGNHDAIWSEVNAPQQQFPVRPYPSQGLPGHPTYMVPRPQFAPHTSYFPPQHYQPAQQIEPGFETAKDKLDELDRELENELREEQAQKQQETREGFLDMSEQWENANTDGLDPDTLLEFSNIWTNMQKNFEAMSGNDNSTDSQFDLGMDYSFTEDVFNEYKYVENNPMSEISDPLQKGKELLAKGDIPGAVLCFEAAVKQDETCVEAWKLLGTTWAENEQDSKAIYALKRGLSLEPHNLDILMALAVSYTNESYNYQACSMLFAWLMNNPEYKNIIPVNFELKDQHVTLLDDNIHKAVRDMFLKAAQKRPINPDYQVQCALGVLFNLNCEYDKAVDCFRSALQVRPQDSRLWNRLGATLANGNKPEEAIDAYHRALNLDPGFVRSRYNVGITCMNMKAYKEAAEHFLITLNQQARGQSDVISANYTSDTIWATFRLCTSLMGRYDLRAAMHERNLEKLNKEFGMTEF